MHKQLPTFVSVKVNFYCGVSTRIKDLSSMNLNNRHSVRPQKERFYYYVALYVTTLSQ